VVRQDLIFHINLLKVLPVIVRKGLVTYLRAILYVIFLSQYSLVFISVKYWVKFLPTINKIILRKIGLLDMSGM
jgi:hypothetical protein